MVINGFGAVCTFIVMICFAITKFKDGAWIIIFLVPALVAVFFAIHHHYKRLAKKLSLENFQSAPAHQPPPGDCPDRRGAPRLAGRAQLMPARCRRM